MVCPSCGEENPNDAVVCQKCGAALASAEEGSRGDGRVRWPLPAELPPPVAAPGTEASVGGDREERRDSAGGWSTGTAESGRGPVPATSEEKELFSEGSRSKKKVTVLGFSQSGKTFMVHRLRHQLSRQRGWEVLDAAEPRITKSPDGILVTRIRRRVGTDRGSGYMIVDCAGETFDEALFRHSTKPLEDVTKRLYLTALASGDAYVFVVPVTLFLGVGNDEAEQAKLASLFARFYQLVDGIRVAKDRVQSEGIDEFVRRGISAADLKERFDRPMGRRKELLQQPVFIALSQADRLAGSDDADLDADPAELVQSQAPHFFYAIANSFAVWRIDFVSAFVGHIENDDLEVDYRLPHHGVRELWGFLHSQFLTSRASSPLQSLRKALAGELPSEWALRVRRWVDRDFAEGGR